MIEANRKKISSMSPLGELIVCRRHTILLLAAIAWSGTIAEGREIMAEAERQGPRGNLRTGEHARRSLEGRAPFVLPYLQPGMQLLDSGCGPGAITIDLAGVVAPGQVTGVDLDPERVEAARVAAAEQGCENVRFQVGDIYKLPFPDASFDAVFQSSVFIHLADPHAAAGELNRVLKPGGLLAASEPDHDLIVEGGAPPEVTEIGDLWHEWQLQRGSDHFFGKHLFSTLRQAGFERRLLSVRLDCRSGEKLVTSARNTSSWLDEPEWRAFYRQQGKAASAFERLRTAWLEWAAGPDSFELQGRYEVVCWKPE
jgi:ubiquinone/menaquinone biosynthesis C-methylase UbiE